MMGSNLVLREIAQIFEANTAGDACEITERIADILLAHNYVRECTEHGIYPIDLDECPRCELDADEDEE